MLMEVNTLSPKWLKVTTFVFEALILTSIRLKKISWRIIFFLRYKLISQSAQSRNCESFISTWLNVFLMKSSLEDLGAISFFVFSFSGSVTFRVELKPTVIIHEWFHPNLNSQRCSFNVKFYFSKTLPSYYLSIFISYDQLFIIKLLHDMNRQQLRDRRDERGNITTFKQEIRECPDISVTPRRKHG